MYKLSYGSKIKQRTNNNFIRVDKKKCLFFFIQLENHTFDLRRIKRNLNKDKKEKKKRESVEANSHDRINMTEIMVRT